MEDLADEIILDTVLKDAFFSTGDIFFELARRLQRSSTEAAATASSAAIAAAAPPQPPTAAATATTAAGVQRVLIEGGPDSNLGGGRDSRRSAGADAQLLSATAAVFDAAFFHSMQLPQKMDVFMLSTPMSLPKIADNIVHLYCSLKRRWLGNHGGDGGGCGGGGGNHGSGELTHEDSRRDLYTISSRTHLGDECDAGGKRAVEPGTRVSDETFSWRRNITLDRVVRALNGISDVSRNYLLCFRETSTQPILQVECEYLNPKYILYVKHSFTLIFLFVPRASNAPTCISTCVANENRLSFSSMSSTNT